MSKILILLFASSLLLFGCASEPTEVANKVNVDTTIDLPNAQVKDPNVSFFNEKIEPDEYVVEYEYYDNSYTVGSDMPAGLYYVGIIPGSEIGKYSVTNEAGKEPAQLAIGAIKNNAFINVVDGNVVNLSNTYAVPYIDAPELYPENDIFTTGSYRVGVDIPEGDYVLVTNDGATRASYTLSNDVNGRDIATEGTLKADEYTRITIKDGQILTLEDCYTINEGNTFNYLMIKNDSPQV